MRDKDIKIISHFRINFILRFLNYRHLCFNMMVQEKFLPYKQICVDWTKEFRSFSQNHH